jgi:hypothetical protein
MSSCLPCAIEAHYRGRLSAVYPRGLPVVVVNEHMPQGGLSWGRLYTGGSGGGKAW